MILQQGANPRSLRVRDGVLHVRDGNKWAPDGENGNKSGTSTTWLYIVLNKLVFNTKCILDYQRRAAFWNAVLTKNYYQIICPTETWLTEHISDSALFPLSHEVHPEDRPSDSGNTKHGGVLFAVTKNIPTNELVSGFQDCIFFIVNLKSPIKKCCLYNAPKISHYP